MITALALGVPALLITWLVLFAALVAIGASVLSHSPSSEDLPRQLLVCAWIGLCLFVAALQVWHLFLPATWIFPVLFFLLAAVCGYRNRSLLAGLARCLRAHGPRWFPALLLLFSLWAANRALDECTAYDSGLYHRAAVDWLRAYPIVPGLANLHGRLGFNNPSFLVAAVFDWGVWRFASYHVVNGFCLWLLGFHLLIALSGAFGPAGPAHHKRLALFAAPLFAPLVYQLSDSNYSSSYSPDAPASVACIAAALLYFDLALYTGRGESSGVQRQSAAVIVALSALAACFKLSAAPFALALCASVAIVCWRSRSHWTSQEWKHLAFGVALAAVLGCTWCARSVLLSGYPAYPASFSPLPVDWRVAAEQAAAESSWIQNFAVLRRLLPGEPDEVAFVGDFSWVPKWSGQLASDWTWQSLVLLPLLAAFVSFFRRRSSPPWVGAGIGLAIAAHAAVWFLKAPRLEFAIFDSWLLLSLVLGNAAPAWLNRSPLRLAAAAVLCGAIGLSTAVAVWLPPNASWGVMARVVGGRLIGVYRTPLLGSIIAPLPKAVFESFTTDSGIKLNVPTEHRAWRAPLLTTPHPTRGLALRDPQDLSKGFRMDGPWEPLNFPNPDSRFLEAWRQFQQDRRQSP